MSLKLKGPVMNLLLSVISIQKIEINNSFDLNLSVFFLYVVSVCLSRPTSNLKHEANISVSFSSTACTNILSRCRLSPPCRRVSASVPVPARLWKCNTKGVQTVLLTTPGQGWSVLKFKEDMWAIQNALWRNTFLFVYLLGSYVISYVSWNQQ